MSVCLSVYLSVSVSIHNYIINAFSFFFQMTKYFTIDRSCFIFKQRCLLLPIEFQFVVAVVVVVLMLYFVASLVVIADLLLKCYCYRLRRCCFGWYHIAFVCVCVCAVVFLFCCCYCCCVCCCVCFCYCCRCCHLSICVI